jgi:hypothetical protein
MMTTARKSLLVSVIAALPAGVLASGVAITGGQDEQDRFRYAWSVTNNGDSPITYFEIPHFRGNLFVPPDGWVNEITQQNGVTPGEVVEGVWMSTCENPESCIQPGKSQSFVLTIATRGGSTPQQRNAIIGFADGSRINVPGVECPIQEPWYSRYVMPLSMGVMFALFLIVQIIRSRKKSASSATIHAESSDGG